MSAKLKLTNDQIAFAIEIARQRQEARRRLDMIPTVAQLAQQLQCSERWLYEIIRGKARTFHMKLHTV